MRKYRVAAVVGHSRVRKYRVAAAVGRSRVRKYRFSRSAGQQWDAAGASTAVQHSRMKHNSGTQQGPAQQYNTAG